MKEGVALPGIAGQCQSFAKSWPAQDATAAVSRDAGDSGACSDRAQLLSSSYFLMKTFGYERTPKRFPGQSDMTTAPCNVYPRAPSRALLMPQALGYI